jgi:SAM-dependent methyltransferase
LIPTPEEVAAKANPLVYDVSSLELGEDLPRYTDWLLERFLPHLRGRVIEVGAGMGTVARRYVDRVEAAALVEPSPVLHARLSGALGSRRGVHVLHGTLEAVYQRTFGAMTIADGSFDVALMVNVLEHIVDDAAVLRLLFKLLKPGGALLVFVPALPALYGRLDARCGHVRRYTRGSLAGVVERAGFRLEALRYFDLLGIVPWFVTGRLLAPSLLGAGSAKLYDRWLVTPSAALERVVTPPLGKNLICIARKSRAQTGAASPTTAAAQPPK